MKTFDYEQVQAVLTPLRAKFEDCAAHGEGNECETLDKHLECCARICFSVEMEVRTWARDVFSGEVVFDQDAERAWRNEIEQIFSEAFKLWQMGRKVEVPCWELTGQRHLEAALWQLSQLLENWVTPKRSVGPSARVRPKFGEDERAAIRKQLAALPPLAPGAIKKRAPATSQPATLEGPP